MEHDLYYPWASLPFQTVIPQCAEQRQKKWHIFLRIADAKVFDQIHSETKFTGSVTSTTN